MATCFISYARRPLDEAALNLVRNILDCAGVSYWWDGHLTRKDAEGLNSEIARAIDEARVVIVLASSQSLSSSYCQAEIIYALSHDKQAVRVEVEPSALPGKLLPLASMRSVAWHDPPPPDFAANFVAALAAEGIDASGVSVGIDHIGNPNAAIVRPKYSELKDAGPDKLREIVRRLNQAVQLNPANPFNHLSLAFIWLHQRDAPRALSAARQALNQLQHEPDAHYAEALALCIQNPPHLRSKTEVEAILSRLAVARRLQGAAAHIDLLSALVISNYYLPRYLKPPAHPDHLLARGRSAGRFDPEENGRTFDIERLSHPGFAPSDALLEAFKAKRS